MPKTKGLTDKERAFIEAYCGPARLNRSKAARMAGYPARSAGAMGSRVYRRPRVKRAINRRLEREALESGEILRRMSDFADASVAPFLTVDSEGETVVDLGSPGAKRAMHLVRKLKSRKKITRSRDGDEFVERTIDLEIHDAKDALVQIGRMRGMYTERDRNGDPAAPTFKVYVGVNPDEAL